MSSHVEVADFLVEPTAFGIWVSPSVKVDHHPSEVDLSVVVVSLEAASEVDQSLEEGEEVVVEEVQKSEAKDVDIVVPSPSSAVEPVVLPSA